MLIDAHVHFFSRRFYEFHAEAAKVPLEEVHRVTNADIPEPDPKALAHRWAEEFQRHGVDRAVLIASLPGDEDSVAAALHEYPDKFIGYCMLNPTSPVAGDRIKRAIGGLGFKGICLFPALHHFDPSDERLIPLYREIQQHGGVVFVHFGLLKVPIREKLKLPPVCDLKYSNPLMLNGAANAVPDLPFIIPHFGGGFFHEAMLLGTQCRNVHVDTSSSNNWMNLIPGLTLKGVFESALHAFGPERILFGTDSSAFPRGWRTDLYQEQLKAMQTLSLSPSIQEKILGGNLERMLHPGQHA